MAGSKSINEHGLSKFSDINGLSANEWQNICEQSPDHIILVDKKLGILYTNTPSPGLTIEDLRGVPLYKLVKENRQNEIKKILSNVLKTGESQIYETEFVTPEGGVIYYESEAVQWRENDKLQGLIIVARNITTRKTLLNQLAASEQLFSSLTELAPIGIYMADRDGKCTYANQAWLKMAGLTLQEALGDGWQASLHTDDRKEVLKSWQKFVKHKNDWDQEYRFMAGDGRISWVHGIASELKNEDGKTAGFIGVNTDITARKSFMLEREKMLQDFIEAQRIAKIGNWSYDVAADKPTWSPEMYRIYDRDQAQGEPGWKDHREHIHPEDWRALDAAVKHAIKAGVPYEITFRILRQDGKVTWAMTKGRVEKDTKGKVIKLTGTVQDITERKVIEESLEFQATLLQNVRDAVIATDENFRITSWNQAAEDQYGWKEDEVLGKIFKEVLKPEYQHTSIEEVKKTISKTGQWIGEVMHTRKSGKRLMIRASISDFQHADGKPAGAVSVNRDVTEEKRIEETFRILSDLSRRVASEPISALTAKITREIVELIPNAQASSIWLLESKRENSYPAAWYGFDDNKMKNISNSFFKESRLGSHVIQNRTPVLINDVANNPQFSQFINEGIPQSQSVICAPLIYQDKVYGGLFVDNLSIGSAFTDQDLDLTTAIANQFAGAIANAQQVEDNLKTFRTLVDMSRKLSSEPVSTLMDKLAREIVELIPDAEASSIWLIKEGERNYFPAAWFGFEDEPISKISASFDGEKSLGGKVIKTRNTILVNDLPGSEKFRQIKAQGIPYSQSVICTPLIFSKKVYGVIYVDNLSSIDAFNQQDLLMVESIANQFAGAIANAQQVEEIINHRKELDESEQTLQTLFANLPGMAYRCENDANWTMVFVSHGCEQLTGYKPEMLQNNHDLSYADVIHPEDRDMVHLLVENGLKSQNSFQIIYRIITADKKEKWVWEKGTRLENPLDGRIYLEGFIADITERHAAQEQVKEYANFLDTTMEQSPFAMWIADPDGTIIQTNQALRTSLGLEDDQIIGKYNFFKDENLIDQGIIAEIKDCLNVNKPARFSLQWHHAQAGYVNPSKGSDLWIDAAIFPVLSEKGEMQNIVCQWVDITEQKMAAQKLEENEVRFRELFSRMEKGVAIYDARENGSEFIIKDMNAAGEQIGQVEKADILGKKVTEIFPGIAESGLLDIFKQVAMDGKNRNLPTCAYEDERLSVFVENEVFQLPSGEIVAIFDDVTERKLKEEELTFQAQVLGSVGESVIATTIDGRITYWNLGAERIYGWTADEVIGRNIIDITPTNATHVQAEEIMKNLMAGKDWSGEFTAQKKDGTEIPVFVTDSPYRNADGKLIGIIGVSRDITQRVEASRKLKESEEKYRLLIENQSDLIVKFDDQWRLLFVSPSYCETFNVQEKDILGKHFLPKVHPDDQEIVKNSLKTLKDPPHTCYHEERAFTRDDWKWFSWSDSAVVDENGKIQEVIAVGRDITERKKQENALEESEARFREFMDHMPLDVYIKNENLDYVFLNDFALQRTDHGLSEINQISINDFVSGNTAQELEKLDRKVLKNKKPVMQEIAYFLPDGEVRWFQEIKFPIKGASRENLIGGIGVDITEQKQNIQALMDSEARFRAFMDHIPLDVYIKNKDLTFEFMNTSALRHAGLREEEIGSKRLIDFIDSKVAEDIEALEKQVLDEKKIAEREGELTLPSGEVVWQRDIKFPIKGNDEKQLMGGISIDLTKQKENERLIREHDAFERILSNLSASFIEMGADDVERGITQAIAEVGDFLGFDRIALCEFSSDRETLVSKNVWGKDVVETMTGNYSYQDFPWMFDTFSEKGRIIWSLKNESAKESAENKYKLFKQSGMKSFVGLPITSISTKEYALAFSDFSQNVSISYSLIGQLSFFANVIGQAISHKETLSALRMSEERYRSVVEDTPLMIERCDKNWNIVFANQAYCDFFGKTQGEIINTSFLDLLTPESRQASKMRLSNIKELVPFYEVETKDIRFDGKERWVRWTVRVFQDDLGEITGLQSYGQDITEEKLAAIKIEESEERYRSVVEDTPVLIERCDESGNIVFANQAYCAFFGKPLEEIIQTSYLDLAKPESSKKAKERLKNLKELAPYYEVETRDIRFDGNERWLRWAVRVFQDEKGEITGLQSYGQDITEQKSAAIRVKESEERYRSVVEDTPILIGRYDRDWNIEFANQAYCDFYGKTVEELRSTSVYDLIAPDARQAARERFEEQESLVPFYSNESKDIRFDGQERWIKWITRVFQDEAGKIIGLQSYGQDITDQKLASDMIHESEVRYRSLAEDTPILIGRYDKDWNILFANQAYREFFGKSLDELKNMSYEELIAPDDRKAARERLKKLKELAPFYEVETRDIRYDGQERWIRWSVRVFQDEKGEITGLQTYGQEIHDQKIARDRIRESEEKYRILFNEMMNAFALHEIICDEKGIPVDYRFLETNPAFETMTGLNKEDVIGKTALEVLPDTEEYWIKSYGDVALTGRSLHLENYSRALDKYFEVIAFSPQKNQFATIFSDITERVTAAQILQDERDKAQNYLEIAEVIMLVLDADVNISLINEKGCKVLGWHEKELIGKNWIDMCVPQDAVDELREVFKCLKVGKAELVETHTNKIRTRNGHERLIEWKNKVLLDKNGQFVGTLSSGEDITDREAARERLKTLNELISEVTKESYTGEPIQIVANQIFERFHAAQGVSIWILNESKTEFILRAIKGYSGHAPIGMRIKNSKEFLIGKIYQSKRSRIVKNVQPLIYCKDTEKSDSSVEQIKSIICAPIMILNDIQGVICVDNFVNSDAFSQEDLALLESIAGHLSGVIENANLFERIQKSQEELRALSQRLVEVHEMERKSVALDLHDHVGQSLTNLKLSLRPDIVFSEDRKVREKGLKEATTIIDEVMDAAEDLSFKLRPSMLDDLGLQDTIEWHAGRFERRTGIKTHCDIQLQPGQRFKSDIEVAVYRVAEESMNNVAKYASASNINISIYTKKKDLFLIVKDDGVGFDVSPRDSSYDQTGLLGMQERVDLLNGNFEIQSEIGAGTSIKISIPIT